MPCENCTTQFTIFKRKKACISCQRLYCTNCLGKRKKNVCFRCEIFLQKPAPTKSDLMDLKTKDLIFYLQSKKINIAGIVEKEELANLIINHVNSNSYYESTGTHSSTSTTPNNEFENYAQSFDQIKQTCQNLFTSISDKISQDFQKTTCFNQPNQPSRHPTTQQPRPSAAPTPTTPAWDPPNRSRQQSSSNVYAAPFSTNIPNPGASSSSNGPRPTVVPKPRSATNRNGDCNCSDDEMDEISEKRQSIFDGNAGPSGCSSSQTKVELSNSSSSGSSSFEEVGASAVKLNEETWQVIEKTISNGIRTVEKPADELSIEDINMNVTPSPNPSSSNPNEMSRSMIPETATNPEVRKLTRRRSDSSLLSLRKSSSITIDMSSFDPSQSGSEVKKLMISCNKCGKAKSNIKREIMKLSEQLKSSKRSEAEVNAKIKEFLDYLESKSQPSEMTETEDSQLHTNQNEEGARFIPSSASHDEIEENIFDENEGINVYPSQQEYESLGQASSSTPRRFISLDDIRSSGDLESLSVKQLKEILMLNRVDFKGCCEKQELKERVERLWNDHATAPPSEKLPSDDLCKICMDAPIECVFLECGHTATCTACGKVLSECPICRSYIVRVVRIFKS